MSRLEEKLYREYLSFFEKAERERRWSVFEDKRDLELAREAKALASADGLGAAAE